MPRMLVGAKQRDLSVSLFGMDLASPLLPAPIGVLGICGQDGHGDLATARAAARLGVPMIASTLSADPVEEVGRELGTAPGLFQLYTPTDRELAESLVRRAEAAGFRGLVVTLDTWIPAGGRATWPPATSRSCAGTAWPTTSPTRSSVPGWRSRRSRTRGPRSCTGPASSATL